MWGGGVPLPTGGGVWGEGCAPSPENVLILALRMVGFGAFWVVFFKVELFVLHAKISVLRLPKLAIARCICRSPEFFLFWSFKIVFCCNLKPKFTTPVLAFLKLK